MRSTALLLPATDAQAAFEVAQRVRRNVSNVLNKDGSPLTMSFGIVEFPLHGATRETLVHAADEALYRAKELGSDRTIVHPGVVADIALRQTD